MLDYMFRCIFLDIISSHRYNIYIPNDSMGEIMTIDQHTYNTLCNIFAPVPPEAGGILGSKDNCICAFVYDPGTPDTTLNCYTPDVDFLNGVIEQWQNQGISFCGLVHSHPSGHQRLSNIDLSYIQTIMGCMPESVQELFFPVVIPGEGIFPYLARRGSAVASDKITITKEK